MALGGVATGSMKAQEAAKAAGINNSSGFCRRPIATAASTGIAMAAVAVLEVSSVRKIINAVTANSSTSNGASCSRITWPPIQLDKPVLSKPAARDRPPPNSTSTPQGILAAHCQSMTKRRQRQSTGSRNSSKAPVIAMLASLSMAPWGSRGANQLRPIQVRAVRTKTSAVQRSPGCMGPSWRSSLRMISRPPGTRFRRRG